MHSVDKASGRYCAQCEVWFALCALQGRGPTGCNVVAICSFLWQQKFLFAFGVWSRGTGICFVWMWCWWRGLMISAHKSGVIVMGTWEFLTWENRVCVVFTGVCAVAGGRVGPDSRRGSSWRRLPPRRRNNGKGLHVYARGNLWKKDWFKKQKCNPESGFTKSDLVVLQWENVAAIHPGGGSAQRVGVSLEGGPEPNHVMDGGRARSVLV